MNNSTSFLSKMYGPKNPHAARFTLITWQIPRACRWQELKDMTRLLGGEQSLKAEVFQTRDGPQVGHCTIKGKVAAQQVFGTFPASIRLLRSSWASRQLLSARMGRPFGRGITCHSGEA